jgi:radial spoke head protein 4A
MDFESAKALLQQDDGNGTNVYDHLSSVLLKILQDKPADAVNAFENISTLVKQSALKPAAADGTASAAGSGAAAQADAALAAYACRDEEGNEKEADAASFQQLLNCTGMFEWAGVTFGQDTYFLYSTMKAIVADFGASDVRLWGKMNGTGADYYVFEGKTELELPEDCGSEFEDQSGHNKYTYWALSSNGGGVVKLPPVNENAITISRQIKKLFTGDLNATVSGYPPFPGNEGLYLAAKVADITHTTALAPAGLYEADDDGNIVDAEEPATDFGGWVHKEVSINSMGRCTAAPEVENADGEMEADPRYEGASTDHDTLADVGEDSPVSVREYAGGVSVAKSTSYTGAVAVYCGGSFANVYTGWGVAASTESYTPPQLPALQTEFTAAAEGEEGEAVAAEPTMQADVLEDPTPPVEEEAEEDE